ncbi:hypothetical protein HY632_03040 [Candidatus Uhrbacteria bacterium]|nr:hypothetical protein [Candidatus Uhrbacteria bacterium]
MLQRLLLERRWGMMLGISAVGFSGFFLFAFGVFWSTPNPLLAAAPDFTGTTRSPASGATGVAKTVTVTIDSSVELAPSSFNAYVEQTSGTNVTLKDVDFVSASVGWAVGSSGTILKTTDGGTTWTSQTSGTTQQISGISAVDASTAYASVGCCELTASQRVLKTTDGGTTWSAVGTATIDAQLNAIYCVNANICFLAGRAGRLYATTNGGTSWTKQLDLGVISIFADVTCVDANTCWAGGGDCGSTGLLSYATTNGGTTWSAQSTSGSRQYDSFAAVNANTVWRGQACGAGLYTIERSTNGGSSWSSATGHALGLDAVDANTVFAVSYSGTAKVTVDGGSTWLTVPTGVAGDLNRVSAIDATTAWAVGASGKIVKYTTGAANVVRLQANTGNTQGGAAAGANLCTSVSTGTDGSGNANRRITCAHADLSADTWYTLTVVGGASGIQSTTGETMTSNVTVVFQTTPDGSPTFDATPPALPTNFSLFSTDGRVNISWVDPPDADLATVRVLRMDGERAEFRGSVARGIQEFIDSGTDLTPGASFTFALQVADTSGNRAVSATKTIQIPAPAPPPLRVLAPVNGTTPPSGPSPEEAPTPIPPTLAEQLRTLLREIFGAEAFDALPESDQDWLLRFLMDGQGPSSAPRTTEERTEVLRTFATILSRIPVTPLDRHALEAIAVVPPSTRNILRFQDALRQSAPSFRSLHSRSPGDGVTTTAAIDADWSSMRILAGRVESASRDIFAERTALKAFVARELFFTINGVQLRKAPNVGLYHPDHWRTIRACVYGDPTGCGLLEGLRAMSPRAPLFQLVAPSSLRFSGEE